MTLLLKRAELTHISPFISDLTLALPSPQVFQESPNAYVHGVSNMPIQTGDTKFIEILYCTLHDLGHEGI